jgi:hypothetical protein
MRGCDAPTRLLRRPCHANEPGSKALRTREAGQTAQPIKLTLPLGQGRQFQPAPRGIGALYPSLVGSPLVGGSHKGVLGASDCGPPDAHRSVLLLPGGANAPRSFKLMMADPTLSSVHLVATTLQGMAGAPVSDDMSIAPGPGPAGELANRTPCRPLPGSGGPSAISLTVLARLRSRQPFASKAGRNAQVGSQMPCGRRATRRRLAQLARSRQVEEAR